MSSFWLATWVVNPPRVASHQSAQPLIAWGARNLAIEVITTGSTYVLLLSTADDAAAPRSLTCRIGFTNNTLEGDRMRAAGFPRFATPLARA